MIAYLLLAGFAFLMGFMAIAVGGAAQETEDLVGEPGKLHVYPFSKLFVQVILYALLFFLPGFMLASAIYPRLPLLERVVFSFGLGALVYAFNVGIWIIIGKLSYWVMSQIFWDIAFSLLFTFIGGIVWLIRSNK